MQESIRREDDSGTGASTILFRKAGRSCKSTVGRKGQVNDNLDISSPVATVRESRSWVIRRVVEHKSSIDPLIGSQLLEVLGVVMTEGPNGREVGVDIGRGPDILESVSKGHIATLDIIL